MGRLQGSITRTDMDKMQCPFMWNGFCTELVRKKGYMGIIDFESLSLTVSVAIFVAGAILIWISGAPLSKLADQLAEQTGLGRAFIGLLLLGGITSLPEVATTVTASLEGNAGMAASNILGGISMQVAILAVVDFWAGKKPISTATKSVVVWMQGVLLVVMLALSAVFMIVPVPAVFHVGIDTIFLLVIFLFALYMVHGQSDRHWVSYHHQDPEKMQKSIGKLQEAYEQLKEERKEDDDRISVGAFLKKKGLALLLLSLLILVAGYFVVKSSEAIAAETGIGTSFAGLVLVAITTSLPEISATIGAIKLKRYDMAFSNIFGTNLFDVALLFLADVLFFSGPVMEELDEFTVAAAMLGILLTAIYLTGISIRSRRNMLGVGLDSWLIMLVYLGGIFMLYQIKG